MGVFAPCLRGQAGVVGEAGEHSAEGGPGGGGMGVFAPCGGRQVLLEKLGRTVQQVALAGGGRNQTRGRAFLAVTLQE